VADNHGFASIGGLSQSWAAAGLARASVCASEDSGQLDGEVLPVDYAANARSLGAEASCVSTIADFRQALQSAQGQAHHGDCG
jgi:3D-(3,5/4)-trihydroxycyclohexane-1,2-dione acylhydrolase (decyclizing)